MTPTFFFPDRKFARFRTIHTWLWYTVIAISILIFAGWQLQQSGSGPVVKFDPHLQLQGFTYANNHQLNISGQLKHVSYLYIDEQLQTTNTDGTFSSNLYVWPGQSTIKVRAVDRYGREKSFAIKVFDPNSASAPDIASKADQLVRSSKSNETDRSLSIN